MADAVVMNQANQQVVAEHVKVANNPFTRLAGLMGKKLLPKGHGLWITPCNGVHSCFMRFEFDAVFVNAQGEVLHVIEAMKPWGLSPMIKGARAVLELPAGAAAQAGVETGHKLQLNH